MALNMELTFEHKVSISIRKAFCVIQRGHLQVIKMLRTWREIDGVTLRSAWQPSTILTNSALGPIEYNNTGNERKSPTTYLVKLSMFGHGWRTTCRRKIYFNGCLSAEIGTVETLRIHQRNIRFVSFCMAFHSINLHSAIRMLTGIYTNLLEQSLEPINFPTELHCGTCCCRSN